MRFTEKSWALRQQADKARAGQIAQATREPWLKGWEELWQNRHAALARKANISDKPVGVANSIDLYIGAKLLANSTKAGPLTDDYEFIRRVFLDAWGVIPTFEEIRDFVQDSRPNKRDLLIEKLMADKQYADPWVGYWEDVLAENPKIYGDVPNSTGPFKEWIYQIFAEDRGYDRMATELVLMEGTPEEYGTLGFRESFGNDVPLAEKALVVAQAFMGANMKCARCHDSPVNSYRQRDLFGIAALMQGVSVEIPKTSSVGAVPGRRPPAVSVTSKPGDLIPPAFVFDAQDDASQIRGDSRVYRESLARWLIGHRQFAEVGVNRIWKQIIGTGLVEPVDDWPPRAKASHPKLLDYLTDEFVASGYSVRHIQGLILKSQTYQRRRIPNLAKLRGADGRPLFAALPERRMKAEEIVDSLHRTARREFKTERMTYNDVNYGYPKRTWQVVTQSNAEDHAVLVRPLLEEIISLAGSFGWRDQRPDPVTVRDNTPNALQPLLMANGGLINRLIRLTDASYYTKLSSENISLEEFIDRGVLNTLSRPPRLVEKQWIREQFAGVWEDRRVAVQPPVAKQEDAHKEISRLGDSYEAYLYIRRARQMEPATTSLNESYRNRLEDVLWVIFNSPEFIFVP